jgi:hypothetical protein
MPFIRSFQGTEFSTALSVGVFIHLLTWASRRFSSSATSTMILIETSVILAIGTTLQIGGTVVGSIKGTTTIRSITASITDLAIPPTAASPEAV